MLSVTYVFLLAAIISGIFSAMGKCPIWVPLICALVVLALLVLPK